MRLPFSTATLLTRAVRPLYVVVPLIGLNACFGFTSPKGVTNSTGSATGGTVGGGTAFSDDTAASNPALIDFDATLVEVTGAARLKATRFLLTASSNTEVVAAGAGLSEFEVKDASFQLNAMSSAQRRSGAFASFSPLPYMALTLDGSAPYVDTYGGTNNGTCGGSCPTSVAGVIGNGLRFGAGTDSLFILEPMDLPANESGRVMCSWAKPNVPVNDTSYHYVMSYGKAEANKAFSLGVVRPAVSQSLELVLSTYAAEFRVVGAIAADALNGDWVHLCASFVDPDGAGGTAGTFALWINGVLAGGQSAGGLAGDMGMPDISTTVAYVGDMVSGTERWLGDLDEPVIFSPITDTMESVAAQIARIYRFTQPDAVYQEEGGVTSPVFDAGGPWPWSAVVVGVAEPYSNTFGTSETGFGDLSYNSEGTSLLWLMDGETNIVPDRSGSQNNGECVGGDSQCPNIESDLHLAQFDGDNDRLYAFDADAFVPSLRSVCVTAALDDSAFKGINDYSTLLSIGKDGTQLDITRVGGQLLIDQLGTFAQASRPVWDAASELQGMHTICITRDGTSMRVYFDGEVLINVSQSGSFAATGNSFFIGARLQSTEHWSGNVSMVGAWSRVLSANEVRGLSVRNRFNIGMQYGTAASGTPDPVLGPSGPSTFYYLSDGVAGDYSYTLNLPTSLTPQQRFRAKVSASRYEPNSSPRITSIEALPAKLPASALVTPKTASTYTTLTSFTAELPPGTTGQVKFRLLKGSETLFWNGTSWAVAGPTDGSSAADINAHLGEFVSAKGAGEVKWQALLLSVDQRQPAGLLRVTLAGVR